jgi:hypothetical protein
MRFEKLFEVEQTTFKLPFLNSSQIELNLPNFVNLTLGTIYT